MKNTSLFKKHRFKKRYLNGEKKDAVTRVVSKPFPGFRFRFLYGNGLGKEQIPTIILSVSSIRTPKGKGVNGPSAVVPTVEFQI